ncbi:GPP34 family phosphoprotein [Acaricomes phytoseiuli]|uniref:GOLPH3/VPS74 family protein n=1 Tax=Acaricomes phytoseiuli TaxID=291968 RepID=UPI0003663CB2|nr:GPP34 family phosphoprotein [Acaricomes phytoseiuli]MCW1249087.1 GPP34 family phosphoprotein [Acaricomes phytoseiuli]
MEEDLLIVEDLMLLLLADDGRSITAAGVLPYVLGGAVLIELGLLERIELDEESGGLGRQLSGPEVRAVGQEQLPDTLLQEAYDTIAERPRRVQTLLLSLGGELRKPVLSRLAERGLIREERGRMLGIIPVTTWPTEDQEHESALRDRIRAVLEGGAEPDTRIAVLIGLLSAVKALRYLRPPLPWSSEIARRAKELEDGDWGVQAVGAAVSRQAAAMIAASVSASVSVAIAANVNTAQS